MKTFDLDAETRASYKDSYNWWLQAGNIVNALTWFIGTCIMITTIAVGALFILVLFVGSEAEIAKHAFPDLLPAIKGSVIFVGLITITFTMLFGLPKRMRNIFREAVEGRAERHQAIVGEVIRFVDTTETLLLRHNLINENDIAKRKSELPEGRLL